MYAQQYYDEARKYDVAFNGMQPVVNGNPLPMFTHNVYGTFVLNNGETLAQAILRKQKQFNPVTNQFLKCVTCGNFFGSVDLWEDHRLKCRSTGLIVVGKKEQ